MNYSRAAGQKNIKYKQKYQFDTASETHSENILSLFKTFRFLNVTRTFNRMLHFIILKTWECFLLTGFNPISLLYHIWCTRPLNHQHDQNVIVKPVTHNLLHAFFCLIESFLSSKSSFSLIIQTSIFSCCFSCQISTDFSQVNVRITAVIFPDEHLLKQLSFTWFSINHVLQKSVRLKSDHQDILRSVYGMIFTRLPNISHLLRNAYFFISALDCIGLYVWIISISSY